MYICLLTKHANCFSFDFGGPCAVVKSLTGQLQSILLSGDPVGHIRLGCQPSIVPLQTQSIHDSLVICKDRIGLAASSAAEQEKKNNPHWFVLVNTDGKLAAVITDVVHGL